MSKLKSYPKKEGFKYHIAADRPGRLQEMQARGYTFTTDASGNRVYDVIGTNPDGAVLMGYLMQVPEKAYKNRMVVNNNALRMCEDQMLSFISRGVLPARAYNIWSTRFLRNLKKVAGRSGGGRR